MFSRETHPGNMPIRVLQYNILEHFEKISKLSKQNYPKWVSDDKIAPSILLSLQKEPVRTPFSLYDTKQIAIQEVYLSYLWSIAYSFFVIYEEGIQRKMVAGSWSGKIEFDTDILLKAEQLFTWALTLTTNYSPWNIKLPNPEYFNSDLEKYYCERVNSIFLDAVSYLFFHECSHIVCNHYQFLEVSKRKDIRELNETELSDCIQVENEADEFAFNSLITDANSDKEKLYKYLAITIIHVANLFIIEKPKNLKCTTHPDIDSRFHYLLEKMGHDLEKYDYVWYLACFGCTRYFTFHCINYDATEADTSIDLFYRYLNIFDWLKADRLG